MNVLVLNAGSATLKFELIGTDEERIRADRDERLARGLIEDIGRRQAVVTLAAGDHPSERTTAALEDNRAAIEFVVDWIGGAASSVTGVDSVKDIEAVGHRVVHGGERFRESVRVTDDVLRGIEACADLAPLHNPANLAGIRAARDVVGPDVPQVAVFDTAYHQTLPEHAYLYALPYELYERHRIRRYGFHGTSHRFVAGRYARLARVPPERMRIVTLHLGNGCSAAAIRGGASVDTSMGFTPLEGLVMGTRSGDLDPALVSFIAGKERLSLPEVDRLLNHDSGLAGLSGRGNDMRDLLRAVRAGDRRADLAIDVFCYRARKYVGAYLAAMDGADAVVFTGGIGENAPEIRARICAGLQWMGLELDPLANDAIHGGGEGRISGGGRLAAWVIPTDEELLIARDTVRCVAAWHGRG
jgi:acetate kinase